MERNEEQRRHSKTTADGVQLFKKAMRAAPRVIFFLAFESGMSIEREFLSGLGDATQYVCDLVCESGKLWPSRCLQDVFKDEKAVDKMTRTS